MADAFAGKRIIGFGQGDFSHDIGIPGETFEHPTLYGALKDMVKMCGEAGVPVMTSLYRYSSSNLSHASYVKKILDAGVKLIRLGDDLSLFGRACQEVIKVRDLL